MPRDEERAMDEYEKRTCSACSGTGTRYDSTNADKVNADQSGTCSRCKGHGFTLHIALPYVPVPIEHEPPGDPSDPAYAWMFET